MSESCQCAACQEVYHLRALNEELLEALETLFNNVEMTPLLRSLTSTAIAKARGEM